MQNVVSLLKEVGPIFVILRSCHFLTDKHYPFSMEPSLDSAESIFLIWIQISVFRILVQENTTKTNTICFQLNSPEQSLCFRFGYRLNIFCYFQENTIENEFAKARKMRSLQVSSIRKSSGQVCFRLEKMGPKYNPSDIILKEDIYLAIQL